MRVQVILACDECKNRNYTTDKNKLTHPERLRQKKFCSKCGKHTLHLETR